MLPGRCDIPDCGTCSILCCTCPLWVQKVTPSRWDWKRSDSCGRRDHGAQSAGLRDAPFPVLSGLPTVWSASQIAVEDAEDSCLHSEKHWHPYCCCHELQARTASNLPKQSKETQYLSKYRINKSITVKNSY